jgi:uncharacterized membrane protein YgcG
MTRWARWGGVATAALVTVIVVTAVRARMAQAESAEVESLIAQGNELRRQGQPDRALPLFQKAYAIARTPRTEGQLGLAELAAGEPVEAEQHLTEALESPEHPWIAKNREALEKTLALAKAAIGEVSIDGGPAGATVVVNGRVAGELPQRAPIRVAPGRIELEVKAPGYETAMRTLHVAHGEHQKLTIALEKLPPVAGGGGIVRPPGGAGSSGGERAGGPGGGGAGGGGLGGGGGSGGGGTGGGDTGVSSATGLRTAAWVTAGGAVVGLGTGIALQLAASSKNSDFNASCYLDGNTPVPRPNMPSVTAGQCTNLHNSWSSDKTWSVVGYAAGAALAVTSGVLFWLSRPEPPANGAPAPGTTHTFVQCAPGLGVVFCRGQF